MVRSYMLGLIQCWLHVLEFDVRVSGLDVLFAHMRFVLFVVLCLVVHVGAQSTVFVLGSCVLPSSLLFIVFDVF